MKWVDKELVPGTQPPIRIGRRVFKSTNGTEKATEQSRIGNEPI